MIKMKIILLFAETTPNFMNVAPLIEDIDKAFIIKTFCIHQPTLW